MKTWHLDLTHSLRSLLKNPGYAGIAILLFALGIGANTAIFSVADAVLLRPLPYADPDRLVVTLHDRNAPVSPADYHDYQKSVQAFEKMGAAQMWGATLTADDRREQIPGLQVTASLMDLLGVPPMLGRTFSEENEHEGHSHVLLLSHGLWKSRFGADPGIVGRTVVLDRISYTVTGVMPASFRFAPFWATRAQMWAPLDLDKRVGDRDGRSLRVFARLKPGVNVKQAQAEMDAVAAHLAEQYPQTNAKLGISVIPLHEKVVTAVRPTLLVLLGTVGFVLLIACATVGNLMLARSVGRRKEMALRLAVGAQRSDLVRLTLVEALVLAFLGAAGGILLGSWAIDLLAAMLPPGSVPRQAELGFDRTALLFGAAVSIASAMLAGILPSIQAMRANLNSDLKDGGRGTSQGSRRMRSQSALVAAEVALSLLLLAGAGLMMRTMVALSQVDGGFDPHHLLTMQISVSGTDYDQPGKRENLFRQVRDHLAALPEVEAVSAVNHLPIGGDMWRLGYRIEGRPAPPPGENWGAVYRVMMPGYLGTMRIHLIEGRDFTEFDNRTSMAVAIINETLAKRHWPGESAIGKVIHYGISAEDQKAPRTIVGVVRDVRQGDWIAPLDNEIYVPYLQNPDSMGLSYLTFALRTRTMTATADAAAAERIVREVRTFAKSLPISEVARMDRIIADELWRQRLAAILMGAFALVALLLAAAGIYGVISHSMRQRAQEIGIRMALGARTGDVIGLALWEGMKPVLSGMTLGLLGALMLTRFLATLLYGVEAHDTTAFAGAVVLLITVCAAANLIPAVRATRVDPVIALRQD
ncbi:MAG TPA: ABC transporter permease [Bryobacteraceae bacterium]|jgi:putative ABC transport system permease protein